jgi:hypothetical protein
MGPVDEDDDEVACRIRRALCEKRLRILEDEMDHEENLKRAYARFPKVNNR